ncbi:MAG: glycosyltransferase family 2 protein [Sphingobacteriales bacterium]|nr:MAG: glycosyltransferase family 2 protein [Sphingobacteriales bacterium]
MLKNIYAIVVTYNGIEWIERCLNSLINSTLLPKIIVIDNGSTDATITFIKENYKTVNLIESKINLGFGQANSIGLKLAMKNHCDYAFLLNQDAWLENEHTLLSLVNAFETKPNFGILSPLHLNGQGTALDLYFADYLQQSEMGNITPAQILNQNKPNSIINTTFVNAAAWLISATCIKKIGGFDPIFFHYGEDRNYTQRTLYYGFKIGVCPQAIILHDREQRLVPLTATPILNLKTDWVNDLNLFCDIHQKNYKTLIFKRIIRHLVLMLVSISNPQTSKYHFQMLKNTVFFLNKIERSRKISLKTLSMAHL